MSHKGVIGEGGKYEEELPDEIIIALYGKWKIRSSDKQFFIWKIGKEYLKDKQIHHDWDNGGYCYLLETEMHKKLHGKGGNNE